MSNSLVLMVCFYNGKIVRTQQDFDYVRDRVVVEPIDVPLGITYKELLIMIYSIANIGRKHLQLIFSCKYSMKRGNKYSFSHNLLNFSHHLNPVGEVFKKPWGPPLPIMIPLNIGFAVW